MATPVTLTDEENVAISETNPLPVTGEFSDPELLTSIGLPSDAAWNGTDPDATVIALLKAIALNTSTT